MPAHRPSEVSLDFDYLAPPRKPEKHPSDRVNPSVAVAPVGLVAGTTPNVPQFAPGVGLGRVASADSGSGADPDMDQAREEDCSIGHIAVTGGGSAGQWSVV